MEKLGEGGEAEVFALDERRVLRRFRRDHPSIEPRLAFTEEVARGAADLDVAVPEILDVTRDDEGRPCFVERRLPGRSLTDALGEVDGSRRRRLLQSYLETSALIRRIEFRRPWCGEIISDPPLRRESWTEYLADALDRQIATADPDDAPVDDLASHADRSRAETDLLPEPARSLVHFDYFPGNVMCDDERITAVIDWSVLSVVGDPDLDVALAVAYLGVTPTAGTGDVEQGLAWLRDLGLEDRARTYRRWAALWWSPYAEDRRIQRWSAALLTDDRIHTDGRPGG